MRKSILRGLALILVIVLVAPLVSMNAGATTFFVIFPTALNEVTYGATAGAGNGLKYDGLNVTLKNSGSYVQNWGFTNYNDTDPYMPWMPNCTLPEDGAVITQVRIVAIVQCTAIRAFSLRVSYYDPWNLTYDLNYSPVLYTNPSSSPTIFLDNVTTDYVWNATMLKNTTGNLIVTVLVYSGTADFNVDYVGLDYKYEGAGGGSSGPSTPSEPYDFAYVDVVGVMGIFGFVGMIAVPGLTVWFFRRDGGNKFNVGIMAFIAFLVCFGFFMGAIGA